MVLYKARSSSYFLSTATRINSSNIRQDCLFELLNSTDSQVYRDRSPSSSMFIKGNDLTKTVMAKLGRILNILLQLYFIIDNALTAYYGYSR